MFKYLFKRKPAAEERRDQTPQERAMVHVQRNGRYSASYSLSYVRVAEWARSPEEHERPKPDVLDQAEVHAVRMEDHYILEAIEKARNQWKAVEGLPTPKLPPPPNAGQKIFDVANIVEIGPSSYKDHSLDRPTEEDGRKQSLSAPKLGDDDMEMHLKYFRDDLK